MSRRAAVLGGVVLAIGFLSACGAVRPIKYYRLTLPATPLAVSPETGIAAAYPVTLIVGALATSHLYREDRIVYGNGREMGTYEYQRWTESPAEMIEQALLHRLRASGRYRSVTSRRTDTKGNYELRGRLQDFQELTGDRLAARVSLELEMRDLSTGMTVWTHAYTHDEPVDKKEVRAVVEALDRNAQMGVSEMVAGLEQYFASLGASGK